MADANEIVAGRRKRRWVCRQRGHKYWNRNGSCAWRGFAQDDTQSAAPTALKIA
jgi:hypothetical protein